MATLHIDWSGVGNEGSRCVSGLARGLFGFWCYWMVKEGVMRFIFVAEVRILVWERMDFVVV